LKKNGFKNTRMFRVCYWLFVYFRYFVYASLICRQLEEKKIKFYFFVVESCCEDFRLLDIKYVSSEIEFDTLIIENYLKQFLKGYVSDLLK